MRPLPAARSDAGRRPAPSADRTGSAYLSIAFSASSVLSTALAIIP